MRERTKWPWQVLSHSPPLSLSLGPPNPSYNETFTFNLPDMTADTLGRVPVRLKVLDTSSSIPASRSLIGEFSTDVESIYFVDPTHELHRRWLALEKTGSSGETSVNGYLQASVTVVGPGEQRPKHDLKADKAKEEHQDEHSKKRPNAGNKLHV